MNRRLPFLCLLVVAFTRGENILSAAAAPAFITGGRMTKDALRVRNTSANSIRSGPLSISCASLVPLRNQNLSHRGHPHRQLFGGRCARSKLYATEDNASDVAREYKLFDVDPATKEVIGEHYGYFQEVSTIEPSPLVMDEVEEWYGTTYRTFRFFSGGAATADGTTLTVRQTTFGCGKLGANVWKGGHALACHLASGRVSGKRRILELGAGVGLPSCVVRSHWRGEEAAKAILATDFWEERPEGGEMQFGNSGSVDKERLFPSYMFATNLEFNLIQSAGLPISSVGENSGSNEGELQKDERCAVQKLDWHNEFDTYSAKMFDADLIIGSDIVYYPEDVEQLIHTLTVLIDVEESRKEALLVLSLDQERRGLPKFRQMLDELATSKNWELTSDVVELRQTNSDGDGKEAERFLVLTIVN